VPAINNTVAGIFYAKFRGIKVKFIIYICKENYEFTVDYIKYVRNVKRYFDDCARKSAIYFKNISLYLQNILKYIDKI